MIAYLFRSRRSSDTGLETAAASVALFPGSGTLAAATVGALGSVAAVAAGGVAILGGGVAAAAFKFSPSLSGEGSMSKEERERRLQEIKKVKSDFSEHNNKVSCHEFMCHHLDKLLGWTFKSSSRLYKLR